MTGAKNAAFGPSMKYSTQADESTVFFIVRGCFLCARWDGVRALLGNPRACFMARTGNQFDPAVIRYHLEFLTGPEFQGLAYRLRNDDLKFGRKRDGVHTDDRCRFRKM